jgi:hypothetical protein
MPHSPCGIRFELSAGEVAKQQVVRKASWSDFGYDVKDPGNPATIAALTPQNFSGGNVNVSVRHGFGCSDPMLQLF